MTLVSFCCDAERKWQRESDVCVYANKMTAIWDNRSAFHSATFDYNGLGERFGNRAVGIGEVPYLDPNSRSRTEELEERRAANVEKTEKTTEFTGTVEKSETITA